MVPDQRARTNKIINNGKFVSLEDQRSDIHLQNTIYISSFSL